MTDVHILSSLLGGLLATGTTTVLVTALGDDSPPPTTTSHSRYAGDSDPDEHVMPGLGLHFLYSIGAGVVLAGVLLGAGAGTLDLVSAVPVRFGYGLLIFVGAAAFWTNIALDVDPEPHELGVFALLGIAYRLVLGAVIGAGVV